MSSSWSWLWYSMFPTSSCFGILLYETYNRDCLPQAVWSILTPCCTLLIFCCSVNPQGQGRVRSFASQVQHWVFMSSQPNALDELVSVACLSVDTVREITGAPAHRQLWKMSVSFFHLELWKAPTSPISSTYRGVARCRKCAKIRD